jgi:hypothetical protein
MTLHPVRSFVAGGWVMPGANARPIADAATGEVFAEAGHGGLDFASVRDYAITRAAPRCVPWGSTTARGCSRRWRRI